MINVPATEVKQRFGQYIDAALNEPVLIEKSGRPSVVMLSITEYERLQAIEDRFWGEQARLAAIEGFVGSEETIQRLQEKLKDA